MKPSSNIINSLVRLAEGMPVPFSSLNKALFEALQASEAVWVVTHGRNKSVKAVSAQAIRNFATEKFNMDNLLSAREALDADRLSRADQMAIIGDSKWQRQRTFKGFLVNSYHPIKALLCGAQTIVLPPEGSYAFIYDYDRFSIPSDVLVVGMENSENFRCISRQKYLFDALYPQRSILFVSRYPQNGDLVRWLKTIPNEYVHFGDLDLAGVHIYLSEFYARLGSRSSFLIPPDYRERIERGSSERYEIQYPRFAKMKVTDLRVQPIVDAVHLYHKGYDQEGYIK